MSTSDEFAHVNFNQPEIMRSLARAYLTLLTDDDIRILKSALLCAHNEQSVPEEKVLVLDSPQNTYVQLDLFAVMTR